MANYMKSGSGSNAGVKAAMRRNPNKRKSLNPAPEGPHSHCMGYKGDGGMKGKTSVSHRGMRFNFK